MFSANVASENDNVQQLVSFLDRDDANNQQQQVGDAASSVPSSQAAALHLANTQTNAQLLARSLPNKNGFTQEEDDLIMEEVRRNPNRRSTHKLFDEIAIKIGRHTGNSIRYRFRTHLASGLTYVYKTDPNGNLIFDENGNPIPTAGLPSTVKTRFTAEDDYALCSAVRKHLLSKHPDQYEPNPKDVILPGKFFEIMADSSDLKHHTKAAWRDRYRKFAIPFGIDKFIEYYETEKQNGRTPEGIKNFTGKHLYKSAKRERTVDEEVGETLAEHNDQFDQSKKRQSKKKKTLLNQQDSNNLFVAGDQDELSDIAQSGNFFDSHAAAAVAAANKLNTPPVPEDFLTEDLVTAKFFEFQPLISVVDKITEIVNRSYQSNDAEQLIAALYAEAGIQKKFGTFIITSVCGDLILIPKFVEIFLKTGENPPRHVHGIWTPQDDEYLKSEIPERLDYLRRLHGTKRIDLRKSFISSDIV